MGEAEIIGRFIECNPETGELFWKERDASMMQPEHFRRLWNRKYADKKAIDNAKPGGYKKGRLNGKNYQAHRLVWLLTYGAWPRALDHIDGNPSNNSIHNLREVTHTENGRNRSANRNNKSGATGVSWSKSSRLWRVTIGGHHIGSFSDFDAAVAARAAEGVKRGYHPNHGRPPVDR